MSYIHTLRSKTQRKCSTLVYLCCKNTVTASEFLGDGIAFSKPKKGSTSLQTWCQNIRAIPVLTMRVTRFCAARKPLSCLGERQCNEYVTSLRISRLCWKLDGFERFSHSLCCQLLLGKMTVRLSWIQTVIDFLSIFLQKKWIWTFLWYHYFVLFLFCLDSFELPKVLG